MFTLVSKLAEAYEPDNIATLLGLLRRSAVHKIPSAIFAMPSVSGSVQAPDLPHINVGVGSCRACKSRSPPAARTRIGADVSSFSNVAVAVAAWRAIGICSAILYRRKLSRSAMHPRREGVSARRSPSG
jgi:hypothetical protein